MLATLIVVFREIIEAGIVIGIVLAVTRHVMRRSIWVSGGIAAGTLGACVVAAFAGAINKALSGFGQEWFNIGILLAAVAMLVWHNVWMSRHGREMAEEMKAIGEEVASGRRSLLALSIVVAVAVLREGSEIVLFLYGIAISGHEKALPMLTGGLMGGMLGIGVTVVTYLGLLRIPNRYLFKVTSALLALLAAGMAAQATAFLEQAQVVTVMGGIVWNSSWLIQDGSLAGKALHTLIGYTAQPSGLQALVYGCMLALIYILMRLFGHAPKRAV